MSLEQLVHARPEDQAPPELDRRDVVLLRWPDQEVRRGLLAADSVPRLLLISQTCFAPVCADELEDWVREPLDHSELDARAATLEHRARMRALKPHVDDAGLIRVGDRWVDLPVSQLPVARLLIEHLGSVVTAERIQATYRTAGGSMHPKAVKAMIGRIKRRLAELDLALTNVRDRGYLLESVRPVGPPLQQFRQE